MQFSASMISGIVGGKITGDANKLVSNIAPIELAKENDLSFLSDIKYLKKIKECNAGILLVDETIPEENLPKTTIIKVKNSRKSIALLSKLAFSQFFQYPTGIKEPSVINPSTILGNNIYIGEYTVIEENVTIGENVKIFPQVYIGKNCKIGDNTILYPGVKLYHNVQIGKNCIIHGGVVIGSDGFGFIQNEDKTFEKIYHLGNVIIKDDVEIGSNCTIDRATFGATLIEDHVKIDNLCQIAHNCKIGKYSGMAAQVGIAGSTTIGENAKIGGQAGIVGHLKLGNDLFIYPQAGVTNDVEDKKIMVGTPAMEFSKYKDKLYITRNGTKIVKKLEDEIKEIKKILYETKIN